MNKALEQLWDRLAGVDYIVLRNYEGMLEEIKNGGDIDILCRSREEVINVIRIEPRASDKNVFNCNAIIGNMHIPLDIRFIDDGYYDKKWEEEMLKRKRAYKNFYVIGSYDEDVSLLYHILIHKFDIPMKYKLFLKEKFGTEDNHELIGILSNFMRENGYVPVNPIDKGVSFNKGNFEALMGQ